MTTYELLVYYANLLILQYIGGAKNYAAIETLIQPVIMPQVSVQTIAFSAVAASGTLVLSYNGVSTASINWNDSVSTIQTKLQAVIGLSAVTVAGSIASQLLTVTFTGVTSPALPLVKISSTLADSGSNVVSLTIDETDQTLPLAVQNAFNLLGSSVATGVQLDVLGKYAGVTRTGNTSSGPVTLNDADFYSLVLLAIARNNAQSSLSAIQAIIHGFFANEMLVFDYENMRMSYLVSSTLGSQNFIQVAISEGLLLKPMGVALSVIYAPVINAFFGFQTYALWPVVVINNSPFNSYANYTMNTPWLTYANAFTT